jgi:hypothetical protein
MAEGDGENGFGARPWLAIHRQLGHCGGMSNAGIQVTYSQAFDALVEVLSGVRRPGDFYATGVVETPMPSLSIEGVGVISFPVPQAQARAMIAQAAERAPYGKGEKTLVDETVRKVWQIAPGKIKLGGKGWTTHFNQIVTRAAVALGCDGATVSAEFYKLLVYDEGGFFVAHRDSEKTPGMFGTLVVALPSEHEGGQLVIRHAGRQAEFELNTREAGEVRYAAFYADCEHEVRPIASGHRICLVYNLVQQTKSVGLLPTPPDHREAIALSAGLLGNWAKQADGPQKIAYLLEHHYTQAGLSFGALKNGDAALAKVLREAASEADCSLYLGIVHIQESGWAEYTGGYGGGSSRWGRDENEDDAEEYEIGEVCDSYQYLSDWRDENDGVVDFGEIPLDEEELLPPGALDDEEPDESHFSEATGNAGAEFERTYLRAALVLWPWNRFNAVCLSAGVSAALTRLGQLVDAANAASDGPARQPAQEAVRDLARLIPRHWESDDNAGGRLALFLGHLLRAGDAPLIEEVARPLLLERYDGLQNEALAACVDALGPHRAGMLFTELFEKRGTAQPVSCLKLWLRLAQDAASEPEMTLMLEKSAATLIPHFAACRIEQSSSRAVLSEDENIGEEDAEKDFALDTSTRPTGHKEFAGMTSGLVVEFLQMLRRRGYTFLAAEAVAGMMKNTLVFCPENILVPALEQIQVGESPFDLPVLAQLWRHCAGYFLARGEHPPAPPRDWAQPIQIGCHCADCRELQVFIHDPVRREYRFHVRKERRQHLHQQIKQVGVDMTHVTERKGRPQTLVCTKTRATYERACQRYQIDLALFRRLEALPASRQASSENLLGRIHAALALDSSIRAR